MFIDEAQIYVKAGKGGDGAVSFRREKYIAKGGPDGGDGGKGGNIIIEVDPSTHGLALYNRQKNFIAENGQNGSGSNKSGKGGEDLILRMPPGTQIFRHGEMIADLIKSGTKVILVKGGNGGWGNQHFASSIKQTPRWSKAGQKGESMKIDLILKTIADVGLIGLPNAGKSTLLSVLSNARPKIADYPFTTLEPNLGALKRVDCNIILADIPGLIAGAAEGKGLGDKFLRHIERTKLLIHLIDAMSENITRDYKIIRKELEQFSKELAQKPEFVIITKADCLSQTELSKKENKLRKLKLNPLAISAVTQYGLDKLIKKIQASI